MPPRGDLNTMLAGWPVRTARELVIHLHSAAGTTPPTWLVKP